MFSSCLGDFPSPNAIRSTLSMKAFRHSNSFFPIVNTRGFTLVVKENEGESYFTVSNFVLSKINGVHNSK
jgi:hypothetical protein